MLTNSRKKLGDESIVCKNTGIQLRRTPCCINLYDESNLPVLSLNDTSALIWEYCDGEMTIRDLTDLFHAAFDNTPQEELKKDIMTVLEKFQQEKVITLR